jgi:hypothetical protein
MANLTNEKSISHIPHLKPDGLPQFYNDINPCLCGACDGYVAVGEISFTTQEGHKFNNTGPGLMHMTSVVLTQDKEGWYQVICAECGKEGIKAASGNTAIEYWNDDNPVNEKKLIDGNI